MPKRVDASYSYTIRGILQKTPPERTPTQFVMKGKFRERSNVNGHIHNRNEKNTEILVPRNLTGIESFLEELPLGTQVIFRESGKRKNKKAFAHSYSVEVI